MPTTPQELFNIPTPGDPAYANAWGAMINTNMGLIDTALAGILAVSTTGGTTILTSVAAAADQARNTHLNVSGALVSDATILWPASVNRMFSVSNGCTGAHSLILGVNNGSGSPAGATVTIPQGFSSLFYSDGTNVVLRQIGLIGSQTINGDLTVSGLLTVTSNAIINGTATGTAFASSTTDHIVGFKSGSVSIAPSSSGTITTPLNTTGTIYISEQSAVGSAGFAVLYDNNNGFVGVSTQGPATSSGFTTVSSVAGNGSGNNLLTINTNGLSGTNSTFDYKIVPFNR